VIGISQFGLIVADWVGEGKWSSGVRHLLMFKGSKIITFYVVKTASHAAVRYFKSVNGIMTKLR
jgi:hypothetical protein